jgi:hypothetical protein
MSSIEQARKTAESLTYLSGFGNEHSSEAVPGALPIGRNAPQRAPLGLYAEQLSGTAFTEPRAHNRRSWLYRIRPSAAHPRFVRADEENPALGSAPFTESVPDPNRLRWNPMPEPAAGTDFVAGLWTLGGNGDVTQRSGIAIHLYAANTSMTDRVFSDADGELLIARRPRLDVYFGCEPGEAGVSPVRETGVAPVVVVQPDFSIIVIGIDPAPLVELLPFCERIRERSSPGSATLRLTRASVVKGAITGLSSVPPIRCTTGVMSLTMAGFSAPPWRRFP